ncbi:hypothetical protein ACFC0D_10800 [Streptomyces sp. NPDC056222]|uniref:hypothetical protein n=1 Tax=Streptomyces sp. NPDC056222 TaxID=3345749 RepID=UPI0035DC04B0
MGDRDWDDDSDYHSAVGCGWIMTVIALVCSLGVVALIAVALCGLTFSLDLLDELSR